MESTSVVVRPALQPMDPAAAVMPPRQSTFIRGTIGGRETPLRGDGLAGRPRVVLVDDPRAQAKLPLAAVAILETCVRATTLRISVPVRPADTLTVGSPTAVRVGHASERHFGPRARRELEIVWARDGLVAMDGAIRALVVPGVHAVHDHRRLPWAVRGFLRHVGGTSCLPLATVAHAAGGAAARIPTVERPRPIAPRHPEPKKNGDMKRPQRTYLHGSTLDEIPTHINEPPTARRGRTDQSETL